MVNRSVLLVIQMIFTIYRLVFLNLLFPKNSQIFNFQSKQSVFSEPKTSPEWFSDFL
jgi:hypothetical protein